MDTEIVDYLEEVRDRLKQETQAKHQVFHDFRNEVLAYMDNNPQASVEDIYDVFGTPDEIIEYYSDPATPDMLQKLKSPRQVKCTVIISLAVIAVCALAFLTLYIVTNYLI